ncbi:MAG: hypothetical protein WC683_10040 [bacterium]
MSKPWANCPSCNGTGGGHRIDVAIESGRFPVVTVTPEPNCAMCDAFNAGMRAQAKWERSAFAPLAEALSRFVKENR